MKKKEKKRKNEERKAEREKKKSQPRFLYDKVITVLGGVSCLYLLFFIAVIVFLVVFQSFR